MDNRVLFAVALVLLFGVFAVGSINAYHDDGAAFPGAEASNANHPDIDQAQNLNATAQTE